MEGKVHSLIPLKDENAVEEANHKVLMVTKLEFLHKIRDEEVNFTLIVKIRSVITSTNLIDLHEEIEDPLNKFVDIIVVNLPSELP